MCVLLTELPAPPLLFLFLLFSTVVRIGSAATPTYSASNVPKARNVPTGEQMLRGRAVRLVQKPAPKTWACRTGLGVTRSAFEKAQGRMFVRYCVALARISSRRGASVEPNSFAFSYQVRAFAMLAARP